MNKRYSNSSRVENIELNLTEEQQIKDFQFFMKNSNLNFNTYLFIYYKPYVDNRFGTEIKYKKILALHNHNSHSTTKGNNDEQLHYSSKPIEILELLLKKENPNINKDNYKHNLTAIMFSNRNFFYCSNIEDKQLKEIRFSIDLNKKDRTNKNLMILHLDGRRYSFMITNCNDLNQGLINNSANYLQMH